MWHWTQGSKTIGMQAAEGLGFVSPMTPEGLVFSFQSTSMGALCEFLGDQQSLLRQELPHLRHLWDSNPRGETPSA